ncbi:hypothetical protein [Hyphobacterium sp.]|uniref:phage terminase large subunit family protein n=1 Tax=Hyphobacterium sp. TaxID=2004662 RepID=UPI003749D72F
MTIKASKAVVYAAARQDLKSFVRFSFQLVHPEAEFADNFHIDALCYQLDRVRSGDTRRLAINLPPRTLKSFIVSIAWPAFMLGHNPSKRFFVISHNEQLAAEHSSLFRKLIDNPAIKQVFPTLKPTASKNTELIYTTSKLGGRTGLSSGTGLTGMGADVIIFDDPISAQDAASQKTCDQVAKWMKTSAMTRFNDLATGPVICVMQRLSIWDPHAQLTENGNWTKLVLPARAITKTTVQVGVESYHTWQQGALLHPARLPQHVLDEQKHSLGLHGYQAQFMQAPLPAGGGLIDVTKFKVYSSFPRKHPDLYLVSIDPAGGGTYAKSYSVILVFAVFDGHLYLWARWRKRVEFNDLKSQTIAIISKYRPQDVIIESASSGKPLLEEVHHFLQTRRRIDSECTTLLHPFTPNMSKEARWDEASLLVSEGRLHIPNSNRYAWVREFTEECRAFPEGSNDDQVDALSQALLGYRRIYDRAGESRVHLLSRRG